MRYTKKHNYNWSNELAYAVGLIASDGCLQKDGRHIDLTSTDIEQLLNFNKALMRTYTIREKTNKSHTRAYHIQFSDVALYDFLIEAGLTPNKSHTISRVNVPDAYFGSFLRGLFDGDGTCYGYWDIRWKSSHMFYTGYVSASYPFLEYIESKIRTLTNVRGGSIRKSTRSFTLIYAKMDSIILYDYMYKDAEIFLMRKKAKLESFINIAKNDRII